jgi:nucleotide-binding universal stress UspA family protein
MKKIIVPVDFSTTAANAAEFAGNLAIFYGGEILLYNAYQMPVPVGEISYPLYDIPEMQQASEQELEMLKSDLEGRLRSKITINIKAEMTMLSDGLADLCDSIKPDLVVIGLSGKNALTKLIVGSNTIYTAHHLKYPVLVIPPKASFTPVRKIGFACDYKEIKESVPVEVLKKIITDFNAELYVINVDFQDKNFTPEVVHENFAIRDLLEDFYPKFESIEAENVTEGLNRFAENNGIDWIVVIPKKHTILQKMFNRSHSKDLLFHSHLPVLCLHHI